MHFARVSGGEFRRRTPGKMAIVSGKNVDMIMHAPHCSQERENLAFPDDEDP